MAIRQNGLRSRESILDHGLSLTAQGGRHRASIGALAAALGMSKSAVHAHFGSKGALDAALVASAAERFEQAVLRPAAAAPPGLARLAALCEAFLAFAAQSDAALTPGHRAFGRGMAAAAEQHLRAWAEAWRRALHGAAADAVARAEFAPGADAAQAAFELAALLDGAVRALDHLPPTEVVRRTRAGVDRVLVSWTKA
ncbi:MAG: helix-turn-helix domain-containing protein [Vicinamibacterales bacterium]